MSTPLFLQIHTLTSYPGTLLNRDDVGFAKRMPFGGASRTRISSQCLKRHWRTFHGEHSLSTILEGANPVALSVRSRHSFERFVLTPLLGEGIPAELARAATLAITREVLGQSNKARKALEDAPNDEATKAKRKPASKEDEASSAVSMMTEQVTVLGKPELAYFLAEARAIAADAGSADKVEQSAKKRFTKDWNKNLKGLRHAAGFDAALFGRMVTSDSLARSDAAVHVAHAFTVHAESAETDYFAAVDDLLQGADDSKLGSGHVSTTELTSGLFYAYVVVDVAQLVSNLEGCDPNAWTTADRSLSGAVVSSLLQIVTRVSPGAKRGSTAPYAYAHLTLVEAGSAQPRTLANAFLHPVSERPDLLGNAYDALASYVIDVDQVFGLANRRALAAIGPKEKLAALGASVSVDALAKFAAGAVMEHV